jgi:hypothetical protein
MKKYLPIATILLIIPSVAFASWWNPSTWFQSDGSQSNSSQNQELLQRVQDLENKVAQEQQVASTTGSLVTSIVNSTSTISTTTNISVLQTKINSLVAQNNSLQAKLTSSQNELATTKSNYAMCKTNLQAAQNSSTSNTSNSQNTNVAPAPASQTTSNSDSSTDTLTQKNTPFDYNSYVKVNISDYEKNPSSYLGWGTEVLTVTVDDFLGAGDRGVANNYIEITDAHSSSLTPDKMMVQFDNADDYSKAIYSLNKGDLVNVYGVGMASQQFRSVGSSDSSSSYEPVIRLQRIDKCLGTSCAYGNTSYVFSKAQ